MRAGPRDAVTQARGAVDGLDHGLAAVDGDVGQAVAVEVTGDQIAAEALRSTALLRRHDGDGVLGESLRRAEDDLHESGVPVPVGVLPRCAHDEIGVPAIPGVDWVI